MKLAEVTFFKTKNQYVRYRGDMVFSAREQQCKLVTNISGTEHVVQLI